jgi:nitrate reductase assembly molybdenum cofactor insertion protein NarJ
MNAAAQPLDSSTTSCQSYVDLLRDAAEWHLLSLLFARPSLEWFNQIEHLAHEVHDEMVREAVAAVRPNITPALYETIFGPGGPAAPREISHRPDTISGGYLAELLGFYQAFGYQSPYHEPPDHVAVEVDFVSYMRLKEAYAVARNDLAQAKMAADSAKGFIEQHLGVIAGALAQTMQNCDVLYLKLAATALSRRVASDRSAVESPQRAWNAANFSLPIVCDDGCCDDFILE